MVVSELDDILQHHGIKGMHWGVHRKGSTVKQHIDSIKREQHWKKVMSDVSNMTTKEITANSNRLQLENELKRLSSSKLVGSHKDKKDYLNRGNMSDQELARKVSRLRATEALARNVKNVDKKQREFGQKILKTGQSLTISSILNGGKLDANNIYDSIANPNKARSELIRSVSVDAISRGMRLYSQYRKIR